MDLEELKSCLSGERMKPYEWQVLVDSQWLGVEHDDVIEAHYCQPGAVGITINTSMGALFINFDTLRTSPLTMRVQRLSFPARDRTEEVGWYFRDGYWWCEYGSQSSGALTSSLSSKDIERHFCLHPGGSLRFSVDSTGYSIDFTTMIQTNLVTGFDRKVRRRPRWTNNSVKTARSRVRWQYQENRRVWNDFSHSSMSSQDIELHYQQNKNDVITFSIGKFSYELDFTVSSKLFEWQLLFDNQWLRIDNDHVIETHYCQPGAKEITINTSMGPVIINFDSMEVSPATLKVQRLSFTPEAQTEDVGWYFKDDHAWREYGAKNSSALSSSLSSRDVELHFCRNLQGSVNFTVGSSIYSIDFSKMTQCNLMTGLVRQVRRRPKFPAITEGPFSTRVSPAAASAPNPFTQRFKWEFMAEQGQWTEYQAHTCSHDSAAIEQCYMQNPLGRLKLNTSSFSYTLDFSKMCQVNDSLGTTRKVRRTAESNISPRASSQTRWQFQDIGGMWKDYGAGNSCSISSQDIELAYQQNPSGTMAFHTKRFSYELNFSAMTQRNLSTNKVRSVRRL